MYKGKRYGIVSVVVILILASILGLSSGFVNNTSEGQGSGQETEIQIPDEFVVEEPDDGQPDNTVTVPKFTDGFQAVIYALNVIETGKGYTSYFSQDVNTMGQTQKIVSKKYRSGNLNLSEEWYYIDFPIGKNEYKSFYTDTSEMKIKTVSNKSNYNYSDLTFKKCSPDKLENFSYADWIGKMNRNPLNSFFTTVNKSTGRVIKFDKDTKNYIIKIQMNSEKLDKSYFQTFNDNGASDVTIKNLTLTFYVNRKTGYMTKIIKDEKITATYGGFASVDCDNRSTEVFSSMNADISEKFNTQYNLNFTW